MDALMIVAVEPLGEELVEALEREVFGQDRNELHPDGAEESLDLAASFGNIGPGVKQRDPEASAGIGEGVRAEGGAIVDVELAGKPTFLEGDDEAVAVSTRDSPRGRTGRG